jgi:hypothetical protein
VFRRCNVGDLVVGLDKAATKGVIHTQRDTPWVERVCGLGQTVELRWYNDGHIPFDTSTGDVEAWIAARFANQSAPNSCGAVPQPWQP